eukprot:scaffold7015_cov88-Cylindrotheca_fusiformis.AAC.3
MKSVLILVLLSLVATPKDVFGLMVVLHWTSTKNITSRGGRASMNNDGAFDAQVQTPKTAWKGEWGYVHCGLHGWNGTGFCNEH